MPQDDEVPLPTPEEIKERCAEVRATWSKRQRSYRRVSKPVRLMTPVVDTTNLPPDFVQRYLDDDI